MDEKKIPTCSNSALQLIVFTIAAHLRAGALECAKVSTFSTKVRVIKLIFWRYKEGEKAISSSYYRAALKCAARVDV